MPRPHHTDRYGVQWKDANETKFLNTATGRWMNKNSNRGRPTLKRLFPDRPVETGGKRVALSRFEQVYRREEAPLFDLRRNKRRDRLGTVFYKWNITGKVPITLERYVDALIRKKRNLVPRMTDEFVTIVYRNQETNEIDEGRTINITGLSLEQILDKVKKLSSVGRISAGSDAVEGEPLIIDLSVMIYKAKFNPNGGKTNTYKSFKTELFHTQSPSSKDNNCLFMIIKQFIKSKTQTRTLRKMTGIEEGKAISIDQLPLVEDTFDISIDVFDNTKEIVKGEVVYGYVFKSEKVNKPKLELLLYENHYYLISKKLNVKIPKEEREKERPKTSYIIFDFETVFELYEEHLLKPYSCAWFKIREEDFENWNYSEEMYNRCKYHCGFNCVEKLMDDVENCDDDEKIVMVGYNNSKFDDFFILDYCNSVGINAEPFIAGGKISLKFKGGHKTFDLCRFVMSSLKDACDDFKTTPSKVEGFSHYEIQKTYEELKHKGKFIDYWKSNKKLEEYNKIDVLATMDLFHKVRQSLKECINLDVTDSLTLASLSYQNCQNSWKEKENGELYGKPAENSVIDKCFRKAIYGGRTQVFNGEEGAEGYKCHHIEDASNMRMVDVKSLYPFIMLNRVFPIGEEIKTSKYIEGKCGVYLCEVKNRGDKYNIIPYRETGQPLNWNYKGMFETWLTSVDIENLKRHNFYHKVKEGYYWEESASDMFSCLEVIKNKKTQQDWFKDYEPQNYNPALRCIYKLLLNSLSGKVAQRNFNEKMIIIKDHNDFTALKAKWEKSNKKVEIVYERDIKGGKMLLRCIFEDVDVYKNPKPSYLSAFIYSYARTYMYDKVISKMPIWYMDTDSALIHKKDMDKIKIGDNFGDFEEEVYDEDKKMCPTQYYAIAPKFYAIFNQNPKKHKIRVKGINPCDKLIPKEDNDEFEKIIEDKENDRTLELYNLYNSDKYPSAYCEELFKRKLEGDKVMILCSQLAKKIYTVNENDVFSSGIRQRMMIKTI